MDSILEGAEVSPFVRSVKAIHVERLGRSPDGYGWREWLGSANDEELSNFSQWYEQRLKVLADPESKGALVAGIKAQYLDRVQNAMEDGWIEERLLPALTKRIRRTELRFFSPFGTVAQQVSGFAQKRPDSAVVLLPTIAGEAVSTHELGHIFGGIQRQGMLQYFEQRLGAAEASRREPAMIDLYNVLNEGYNEHVTQSLLHGHPEVVSPVDRADAGIPDSLGSSDLYRDYRELFALLIGGSEGRVGRTDIRQVVDSMAAGNFGAFAELVGSKWLGRDVVSDMLEVCADDRRGMFTNPKWVDDPKRLTEKLTSAVRTGLPKDTRTLPPTPPVTTDMPSADNPFL